MFDFLLMYVDSSLEVHVDVCALYRGVCRGGLGGEGMSGTCVRRRGLGGLGRVGDKKCVQPNKLTYLI